MSLVKALLGGRRAGKRHVPPPDTSPQCPSVVPVSQPASQLGSQTPSQPASQTAHLLELFCEA